MEGVRGVTNERRLREKPGVCQLLDLQREEGFVLDKSLAPMKPRS